MTVKKDTRKRTAVFLSGSAALFHKDASEDVEIYSILPYVPESAGSAHE